MMAFPSKPLSEKEEAKIERIHRRGTIALLVIGLSCTSILLVVGLAICGG